MRAEKREEEKVIRDYYGRGRLFVGRM